MISVTDLLANRGLLRMQSGRLLEAVADLKSAIRLKPQQYQAHSTLSQVLQRQGRPGEASEAFSRAIACRPEPRILAGLYRTRALLYAPRTDITPSQQAAALATSMKRSAWNRTGPSRPSTTSGAPGSLPRESSRGGVDGLRRRDGSCPR